MKTIFAVRVPFLCEKPGCYQPVKFNIRFNVIEGRSRFLIGLPSLLAMRETLNFWYSSLFLTIDRVIYRHDLIRWSSHLHLPLACNVTHQRALWQHNGSYDAAESDGDSSSNLNWQNRYYISLQRFFAHFWQLQVIICVELKKIFANSLDTQLQLKWKHS